MNITCQSAEGVEHGCGLGAVTDSLDFANAVRATAEKLAPRSANERGRAAFKAGKGGVIPDEFRDNKESADEWLAGWDSESLARGEAA